MFVIGFYNFFEGVVDTKIVFNLEDAISDISRLVISGQTVLFSPACSSFDQFRDYEERGEVFRELIHKKFILKNIKIKT